MMALIPVCTRSPFCRPDIFIDFPFLSSTLELAGKQPLGGGGAVVVVVPILI